MEDLLTILDTYFFTNTSTPLFTALNRKIYRLAFHDCMGGCDGSIASTNADNNGLSTVANVFSVAYSSNSATISPSKAQITGNLSRADFFALIYLRAVGYGIKRGGGVPTFSNTTAAFKYGRGDNPNGALSDDLESTFPTGSGSWTANMATITAGLAGTISDTELVTLLGLHGSGLMNSSNSGYSGPWGPATDHNVINNNFYKNLLGVGFPNASLTQNTITTTTFGSKVQWNGTRTSARVMLHADMGIYYDYTPDPVTQTTTYTYFPQGSNSVLTAGTSSSHFPLAATRAQQAFEYANNNVLFLDDLISAMKKLSNVPN